jgi:hypothetical protein
MSSASLFSTIWFGVSLNNARKFVKLHGMKYVGNLMNDIVWKLGEYSNGFPS